VTQPGIDWADAHRRLALARRTLERDATHGADEARRLLDERARELARTVEEEREHGEERELLVLAIGGEHHAIEAALVLEALPPQPLTPIPCTPAFVLGVVVHRGRVLPVLELGPMAGAPASGGEGGIVALEVAGLRFGIAVDAVAGLTRHDEAAGRTVRAPAGEPATFMDLRALAAQGRLEVGGDGHANEAGSDGR
jgi:purine-binding chemotaxis protein CheW